ncbi:MAG: hypothetical protein AB1656_24510 [Candidatus Omnitrophota bacterium]
MNTPKNYSRSIALALFLLTMGVYLCLSPAHFLTTPDEEINLRTTLSLVEGKWGAIPPLEGFASKKGADGKEYAQYGLGLPLAAAPWGLIGKAFDPGAADRNRLDAVREGEKAGTIFLRWWMTVFTMLISSSTVVLFNSILRHLGLNLSRSIFFTLLLAFGTMVWPHGRTFFTEPLTAFCLMAAMACFLKSRNAIRTTGWIFLAGLFWAYALFTRLDALVTLPAAFWLLCITVEDGRIRFRFSLMRIAFFSIPFLVAAAAIAGYNVSRFGAILSTGYEDQPEKVRFITPLLVGLHGFLLSPGRSLFVYSPPLIFSVIGFGKLWKRDAWLFGGIALLCAGYLGAMSKWQNWAGGYDWGPRHIYQITPFLMIAASMAFLDKPLFNTSGKRIAWMLFLFFSVFVQILGLAADPMIVIKSVIYPWPAALHPYIMQFTIYLPHFSAPVLHWFWLVKHGPDLLIFTLSPSLKAGLLIPAVAAGWGIWTLVSKNADDSRG